MLNVQLANPEYWAMVLGTSGLSPNPPNFHCTLAVDGNVVVEQLRAQRSAVLAAELVTRCSMRLW